MRKKFIFNKRGKRPLNIEQEKSELFFQIYYKYHSYPPCIKNMPRFTQKLIVTKLSQSYCCYGKLNT